MAENFPDVGEFGAAFQEFLSAMTAAARRPESPFATRLREHLGVDPRELPSTVAEFGAPDHPNLQLALDAVLADAEVIGYSARQSAFVEVGLTELLSDEGATGPIRLGPVQYTDVQVGDGRVVQCVSAGLYLARREGVPLALVLSRSAQPFGGGKLRLEGISPEREAIPTVIGDLRAAMGEHNVYRGKVISLHQLQDHTVAVQFHTVRSVEREAVVLPDGTLERVERHAMGITDQVQRLRETHRHVKRGVLLHGPPGTGKTLSVSYLLGAMPGRTTILLTGRGLGLIEQALRIAHELAPATVVLEDVDLVAAERTTPLGNHGILFELLNQMEGLDEDADLLFLLTTNRPDIVEPALVARPGRIDLAVELPLPDAADRRRLLRLYAHDISIDEEAEAELVERTDGVSGAFIKELMRQAALRAALRNGGQATMTDVRAVLDELLSDRSALTRRLLGQPAEGPPTDTTAAPPLDAMLRAFEAAGLPLPPNAAQD
ncbi:MAG: AAA family ATPase [Actinomycetota bacterium]|nr:AAA family ATPase [Actinomycetota bacterium]